MLIEKNEVFDVAFRFVTETAENIFLTGKAGTGKTTFLKYLKDHCTKTIVVAAPTGVAAINAGGVTLHSLFSLPFHPFLPGKANREALLSQVRLSRQKQDIIRAMELLVIDEISMVRCDVMDAIDTILQSVRRKYNVPFGGVQLLCIGDLYQLPPVAQNEEWRLLQEHYASPFFFDSRAIQEQMPLMIELTKIYRQKESSFVDLLNSVRTNSMTTDDFARLNDRYLPGFIPSPDEKFITLTSHNKQAELINHREIEKLHNPLFIYKATIENEFPENIYPAEADLRLKEGAQVMFLKNDAAGKRYFNGKIGVIKSLTQESVVVDCNGEVIEVYAETWENTRYAVSGTSGKLEQKILGTFSQYPLRLAWAITIHKSQGLTFEKVMIDAGAAFSSGQVYVALSRCTSLDGIILLSKIPPSVIFNNEKVMKAEQNLACKGSLDDKFAGARRLFTGILLEEIFSFDEAAETFNTLNTAIRASGKFNADGASAIAAMENEIIQHRATGKKFLKQVSELLIQSATVETNPLLQQRISAAAFHFSAPVKSLFDKLSSSSLATEHKESADTINPLLEDVAVRLSVLFQRLLFCEEPFGVTAYLQHKLKTPAPKIRLSCYAGKNKAYTSDGPNPELYNTLKRWRDMVCEETGMSLYMLCSHNTLNDICTALPLSKKDLRSISGFGEIKVSRYGDDIIHAVENYCSRHGLSSNMEILTKSPKKEKKKKGGVLKPESKSVSFEMFNAGKSPQDIAAERGLALSTVEGHLSQYVSSGELDISAVISAEKLNAINDTLSKHQGAALSDVKLMLPEISYADFRYALAKQKFDESLKEKQTATA